MSGKVEAVGRKKRDRMVMLAITIAVVAILMILTIAVPDRTGQVRTDLQVGDYYAQDSNRYYITYVVKEVNGNDVTVTTNLFDKSSGIMTTDDTVMSKENYLSRILFSEEIRNNSDIIGTVFHDTIAGHRFCRIYYNVMNAYHVGEYGVIYAAGIGGNFWTLSATSLLYGVDHPVDPPEPKFKIREADADV